LIHPIEWVSFPPQPIRDGGDGPEGTISIQHSRRAACASHVAASHGGHKPVDWAEHGKSIAPPTWEREEMKLRWPTVVQLTTLSAEGEDTSPS
jgi:hypothetical protein